MLSVVGLHRYPWKVRLGAMGLLGPYLLAQLPNNLSVERALKEPCNAKLLVNDCIAGSLKFSPQAS